MGPLRALATVAWWFLAIQALAEPGRAQALAWGDNASGQCNVPTLPTGMTYLSVAAGAGHSAACRSDGWIMAWTYSNSDGQATVPVLPPGLLYVEVSAGSRFTVGRRSDGSVVAWGWNFYGQCNVPPLPPGVTYVEIASGMSHTVARRSNGTLVAWGDNVFGQLNVPPVPPGVTFVEIAAGGGHSIARRSDGNAVAWGANNFGQCNVPPLPPGMTYISVAAGGWYGWTTANPWFPTYFQAHTLAVRSDGQILAWGDNTYGQCNVPPLPPGVGAVEVAAGWNHSIARLSNGSVIAWGPNWYGECNVPALPGGSAWGRLAAGSSYNLGLYGPSGAVTPVGTGCGGSGSPSLSCNAPRLGHFVFPAVAGATPNASGFLYGGGIPAAPLPLGSGCVVQIDLASHSPLLPVTSDASGTWGNSAFVPEDPALVGVQLALQVALFGTPGPLGFDLSNGLIATIGW